MVGEGVAGAGHRKWVVGVCLGNRVFEVWVRFDGGVLFSDFFSVLIYLFINSIQLLYYFLLKTF